MSFPATSPALRRIPPLSYAIQNIFFSAATVLAAYASLGLTFFIVLPLSLARMVLLLARDAYLYQQRQQQPQDKSNKKKKVVLVVGATHGIGLNIVKQYARGYDDAHVTIIAAGRSTDELAQVKGDFEGFIEKAPSVRLHTECFDIGWDPKAIAENVSNVEKKYGPITHLYAVTGLSSEPDKEAWGLDITLEMIQTDVIGLVSMVLATYERMKMRREGKICIIGSTTGFFAPANMIAYASSKAFINTFGTSLRSLAHTCTSSNNGNGINGNNARTNSTPDGIEVTTILPGYIELGVMGGPHGNTLRYKSTDRAAKKVVNAVERGGEGVCVPGTAEGLLIYALKGMNPICDEAARWATWKMSVRAKKAMAMA